MKLRRTAFAAVSSAALVAAPLTTGTAHAASDPVYDVGFVQNGSVVNSTQTVLPVTVGWRLSSSFSGYSRIYREDNNTGNVTLLGTVSAGTTRFTDMFPLGGGATSQPVNGAAQYQVLTYDAHGNFLGEQDSNWVYPLALDDAASGVFSYTNGTWYRKKASGTTLNHYTYSSSRGATITVNPCGYSFGVVATKSPAGGTANVMLNGVIVNKINLHATSVKNRQLVWKTSSLTDQCPTISIVELTGQLNIDSLQFIGD